MLGRILRLPPVLGLLVLAAAALMQVRYPRDLGVPSLAVGMSVGVVLWLVALTIGGAALLVMKKHKTTAEPGQRPTSLVTSGVFRATRNPLYVSLLLIVTGLAVVTDVLWFAIGVIVLWFLLDRVVVRWEERMLEETFGEEYLAYKRRTRRWL